MTFPRPAAVAAALILAGAPAAFADGYPFTGLFVAPGDAVAAADRQLLCGYNFFVQNDDGSFVNYHLDLPAFRADGTVRFVVYTRGHCRAEGMLETCRTDWDSDADYIGQEYFDVLTEIGPDKVTIANFATIDEARASAATGTPRPDSTDSFYRCPYEAAAIAKYRSETESTLTGDERTAMFMPDLDDGTRATMTAVLAAIADGK